MTPDDLTIRSQVKYEFMSQPDAEGLSKPFEIGSGAFARVLKAWQKTDDNRVRQVAIKILLDEATHTHEQLFDREIQMVKELNATGSVNVVSALDIIDLPPLVMCASGIIYQPHCPYCGQGPLRRIDPDDEDRPCLKCDHPQCEAPPLSPKFREEVRKLFSARAKPFPVEGPATDRGTVINFVHRRALVMELLESKLPDFLVNRRRSLVKNLRERGIDLPFFEDSDPQVATTARPRILERLRAWWWPDAPEILVPKTMLLEKLLLMVQLAESVAWLHHRERQIVHKDLAPDNVMVHSLGGVNGAWRGSEELSLKGFLDERTTYPTVEVRVIDFGLADQVKLTRSWYEDEAPTGQEKSIYMSPEGKRRRVPLNGQLEFDLVEQRFPIGTLPDIREGDIIADVRYSDHEHDIEIVRVETDTDMEAHVRFTGTPDPQGKPRLVHIRVVGEAHDVYSLGTLFYYILTDGMSKEVDLLGQTAAIIEREAGNRFLTTEYLRQQTGYERRVRAIREPHLRDELILLIMRMLIRGASNSYFTTRIERGPEPARYVLRDVKQVHHRLMQDVLAAPVVGRTRRLVTAGFAFVVALGIALGLIFGAG